MYTICFLAIGFLEWKESRDAIGTRKSPLILIPVELNRRGFTSTYSIKWTHEDIGTNFSLQAKIEEQSVLLPDFEMPEKIEGINQYGRAVEKAIRNQESWRVTREIYLGFFSFTKFVMYRDLEAGNWPEGYGDLIGDVFSLEDYDSGGDDTIIDEEQISRLKIRNQFHVMDADASQVDVIENAKVGRNLVVEGPPGTGKSQTITNMIAELLANEKTVLFISEKMAALEVVKNRLEQCGLGNFCLELHSRHTNKRAFYSELERTLNTDGPSVELSAHMFDEHDELSNQLNDYVKSIKEPILFGKSPYDFIGICMKSRSFFEHRNKTLMNVPLIAPTEWSMEEYDNTRRSLRRLVDTLPEIGPLQGSPWRGRVPHMQTVDST